MGESAQTRLRKFKKWLPVIGVLLFVGVGVAMIFLTPDEVSRPVPKMEVEQPNARITPRSNEEMAPNGEVPPDETPPPQRRDEDTPLARPDDGEQSDDEMTPPDIPKFFDPLLDDDEEKGKPAPFSRPDDN